MSPLVVDRVNFLLGGRPSWPDRVTTNISAGSEADGRPVSLVADPRMGNVWRSTSLKPRHTWVLADYGANASGWPARACFLGRVNLPDANSKVRIRRGDHDFWWESRLLYNTNGVAEPVGVARYNTTAAVADIADDPLDPVAPNGTATNGGLDMMSLHVPFRRPPGSLASGAWKQVLQSRFVDGTGDTGHYVHTAAQLEGDEIGSTTVDAAWDEGDGLVVIEDRFDADDLTNAASEVWCYVGFNGPDNVGTGAIGGMKFKATLNERTIRASPSSVSEDDYENLASTDAALVKAEDVFDAANLPGGLGPANPTIPYRLVGHFADLEPMKVGDGLQEIAVALRRASGIGDCGVELHVRHTYEGSWFRTGDWVSVELLDTTEVQWVTIRFNANVASSHDDLGYELVIDPQGDYAEVLAIACHAAIDEDACEYDSGWIDLFEPRSGSWWGYDLYLDLGKPSPRSVAHVYFDENGDVANLTGQKLLVELWYQGGSSFVDDWGATVDYAEMGRLVDGPAIVGMNLAGGFEIDAVDTSAVDTSEGGVQWEDEEEVYRVVRLRLSELSAERAVADIYEYLIRRSGVTGDLLLVIFPESALFRRSVAVWGPPERPPKVSHDRGAIFRADIAVKERL